MERWSLSLRLAVYCAASSAGATCAAHRRVCDCVRRAERSERRPEQSREQRSERSSCADRRRAGRCPRNTATTGGTAAEAAARHSAHETALAAVRRPRFSPRIASLLLPCARLSLDALRLPNMLRILRPTVQAARHSSMQRRNAAARFAAPLLSSSAMQRWNAPAAIHARSLTSSASRLARSSRSEAAEAAAEAAAESREQADAERAGAEFDAAVEDVTIHSRLGWSDMTRRQLHEHLEGANPDAGVAADVLPEVLESSHHSSGMAELMGDADADVSPLDQELPGAELWDAEPLQMDDPFEPDAELDERELDESHVADDRFTFEEEVVDPQWMDEHGEDEDAFRLTPRMKKIVVDRQGIPLRHKNEYSLEEREPGQDYPGFIVQIKQKDEVAEEMEGTKDPLEKETMEEAQSSDLEYKVETDPDHHWYTPGVLDTQSVKEGEEEYIVGAGAAGDGPKRYLIGGKEVPQTVWQGRKWITFPRTWEDIRKNGKYPSTQEVEAHIATILGEPRPDIPISPPREPKPQEYIWTSSALLDESEDLMNDEEWNKQQTQNLSPKTWFMEARQRYKKKVRTTTTHRRQHSHHPLCTHRCLAVGPTVRSPLALCVRR